ncbi:MAG: NAD(P)H-hydrate dehydratase [Burkholderiales bacterium]|nr:NAD(P)H-hydrate dehydratase [Flavobacterium sp.]
MKKTISIGKTEILQLYKAINSKTHKGIQGHALLIGGSYGKMGSICLSSKAALHSGCGLVTAFVPKCGYTIIQTSIPEVMVLTDGNQKYLTAIAFDLKPQAIGIGPGLSQETKTQKAIGQFLKDNKTPLVVDADALNILAKNPTWLALLPPKTILTPHQKELERLIGKWYSDAEKLQMTIDYSIKHNVIVVMKGAPTIIIDGETIYQNTTGNAALATAGTGDVLTGIITGLLAQSYSPIDAATIGVYLHGLTADLALPETGYQSFIASDCIRYLGKAYLSFQNS